MRKLLMLAMLALVAMGGVLAQGGQGQGGFPGMTDEMRKKLQAYQPVFDLTRTVGIFDELDKQKGLNFTKAQAQKLLPVLRDLLNRADLKPADAQKILTNLEDNILTDAQLTWIDKTQLERQRQARERFQQGQGGQGGQGAQGQGQAGQGRPQGQGGPGGPGGPGGAGGPGGRGGLIQAIMQNKPFNPFKEQQRTKEQLTAFVAVLQKR
ncbi:MAG: hypothetical protein SFU83_19910 [Meiothermus sp.]|nr:hypothetical protein [Meiothermus sp.]